MKRNYSRIILRKKQVPVNETTGTVSKMERMLNGSKIFNLENCELIVTSNELRCMAEFAEFEIQDSHASDSYFSAYAEFSLTDSVVENIFWIFA